MARGRFRATKVLMLGTILAVLSSWTIAGSTAAMAATGADAADAADAAVATVTTVVTDATGAEDATGVSDATGAEDVVTIGFLTTCSSSESSSSAQDFHSFPLLIILTVEVEVTDPALDPSLVIVVTTLISTSAGLEGFMEVRDESELDMLESWSVCLFHPSIDDSIFFHTVKKEERLGWFEL